MEGQVDGSDDEKCHMHKEGDQHQAGAEPEGGLPGSPELKDQQDDDHYRAQGKAEHPPFDILLPESKVPQEGCHGCNDPDHKSLAVCEPGKLTEGNIK